MRCEFVNERTQVNVEVRVMPLYWLCYRHHNRISVVIEPAHSLIYARLRATIDGLDQGEFTEGHELDRKMRVPKEMIGRRLSQEEAKRLLAKFNWISAATPQQTEQASAE
jgi:hypothetical protein